MLAEDGNGFSQHHVSRCDEGQNSRQGHCGKEVHDVGGSDSSCCYCRRDSSELVADIVVVAVVVVVIVG